MRILHVTNNYPTDNFKIFGIFVKEQIESLNDLGIKNDVIFFNTREKGKKEYLKGVFKLFKHLLFNKYDVIHCHHAFSAFITIISVLPLFSKKIVSYQGSPDIEGKHLLFKIINFFFQGIIFKAKFDNYKSSKVFYLPNGVNTDFFKPQNQNDSKSKIGLDFNKKYLLFMDSYVGRPYKRYDRFSKVFEILQKEYGYSDIEMLVLNNVDRSLIPYHINSSAVHVLTSDTEGSPNSVKECMSCNIPVVSTPVGNVQEMIKEVNTSFVSNTFEEKEIARLVSNILESKIENNGRAVVFKSSLDRDNVARKLELIYKKL